MRHRSRIRDSGRPADTPLRGARADAVHRRPIVVQGPIGTSQERELHLAAELGCIAVRVVRRDRRERERSSRIVWCVRETLEINGFVPPTRYRREWQLIEKGTPLLLVERTGFVTSPCVGADCAGLLKVSAFRMGALLLRVSSPTPSPCATIRRSGIREWTQGEEHRRNAAR